MGHGEKENGDVLKISRPEVRVSFTDYNIPIVLRKARRQGPLLGGLDFPQVTLQVVSNQSMATMDERR